MLVVIWLLARKVEPGSHMDSTIMSNTEILMQCLMDSSKTRVSDILGDHSDIVADIKEISRNLIFDIHNNRAVNI